MPGKGGQTTTKKKTAIPPAPSLAPKDNLVDPLLSTGSDRMHRAAHSILERSEVEGGHARAEHDGNDHSYLDGRGKPVATSFMSTYDQDKSFRTFMDNGGGASYLGTKKKKAHKVKKGVNKGKMMASDIHDGDAGQGQYRTAPLARVSERQADGSYEHFNAKVKGGFAKFTKENGKTRAQTFFPNDYEKLERPLPGGQVPTTSVQGDSIDDVKKKLRPTNTVEKTGIGEEELGRVVEPPTVQAPTEEASTAPEASAPPKPVPNKPLDQMSKSGRKRFRKKLRAWESQYGG